MCCNVRAVTKVSSPDTKYPCLMGNMFSIYIIPAANKSPVYGWEVFAPRPPGKYLRFLCQQNISKLLFYIYSLNSSLSCQTHNYFHISTWCVSWARRSCLFNLHHLGVGGGLSEVTLWCLSCWQIRAHMLVQHRSKAAAAIARDVHFPPLSAPARVIHGQTHFLQQQHGSIVKL